MEEAPRLTTARGAVAFGLEYAVKRANSLDADKVREQLLKLEMRTPFGDYKVEADGFQVAHKMVTFQWQKEKKVTGYEAPAQPQTVNARYAEGLKPGMRVDIHGTVVAVAYPAGSNTPVLVAGIPVK